MRVAAVRVDVFMEERLKVEVLVMVLNDVTASRKVAEGDEGQESVSRMWGARVGCSECAERVSAREARKQGSARMVGSGREIPPNDEGAESWKLRQEVGGEVDSHS